MVQYWLGCGLASHYTQEAVSLFLQKTGVCVVVCTHTYKCALSGMCKCEHVYTGGTHVKELT